MTPGLYLSTDHGSSIFAAAFRLRYFESEIHNAYASSSLRSSRVAHQMSACVPLRRGWRSKD